MRKMLLILIFAIFLIGCTKTEVPDAVKNLEKFKFITIEHPNKQAPSFTLTDDKGKTFTSNDLKGKIYILQGFAPGCSSCAREIATLSKVYDKFKDKGLEIISLDIASETIDGAIDTKTQFNGGDWRWVVDLDNVAIKFEMRTLESTYIIDKTGIIRYKDESISNSDVLSQEIEKLI
ncbi:MAG: TlpA disulfide reductase family protein [Nanoarchaeota archaeon]|nr:TlpA disulfide reductase family protein [Nanoarchaeota archaeon]